MSIYQKYKQPYIGLSLVLLMLCQVALGLDRKNFKIDYLNISSGLSINYVSEIITDKNGLKWFATKNGVNRFDGVNFKHFFPSERYQELLNENIKVLALDLNGNIWVGTESGGLSKYNVKEDTFTNYNHLLTGKEKSFLSIRSLCQDKYGHIWVASSHGVFIIDIEQEQVAFSFTHLNDILHIAKDATGDTIWMAAGKKIYKYTASTKTISEIPSDQIGWIMELFFDKSRNNLLIGTGKGLYELSSSSKGIRKLTYQNNEISSINAINIDKAGRVWIGSWQRGLYVSNPARTKFYKFSLLPADQVNKNYELITDIHIDDNQQIWIASGFAGVIKLIPQRNFKNYMNMPKQHIGLPDNNIQNIHKDRDGNLWCGTRGNGLGYSKNGKTFTLLPDTDGEVVSCFTEVNNKIIVGYDKGLLIYNLKEPFKKPYHIGSKKLRKVRALYVDTQKRLWIGTQLDGLASISLDALAENTPLDKIVFYKSTEQTTNTNLKSARITAIDEDQDGNIWIATYRGIHKYDYKKTSFINYTKHITPISSSLIIHSLYTKEEGKIWVGFSDGLMEFACNESSFTLLKHYTKADGLDNNFISAITKDGQGNLWLGHSKGIAYIPANTSNIYNFGEEEGVEISPINPNAIYNDSNQIYFGGENGLVTFAPQFVDISTSQPKVNFTDLFIDNQYIQVGDTVNGNIILKHNPSYTSHINLTHKEKVVELSFVANDHLGNKNLHYYYRLAGMSDEWVNNRNFNNISFRNLPSGDYTLEVRASRDKIHFGDITAIRLSVAPAPWASTWAYMVYLCLFILILYIIIRNVVKQTQLRANIKMAKMEKEKEHELAEDKLRFFTNISHELRTPLTLILSPLSEILHQHPINSDTRSKLSYIDKNANRLLTLINQLLDFRKAETGNLNVQVSSSNFVSFAEKVFQSFKGHAESSEIIYTFDTEESDIAVTFDKDKMETVLSNLLFNAFKHTPKQGYISLSVSTHDNDCYIAIKDSGKGIPEKYHKHIFSRFFQIQQSETANMAGSGIGLSLSKKIVELHHGTIEVRNNKGAEFIVKIPLGDKHFDANQFEAEQLGNTTTENTAPLSDLLESEEPAKASLLIIDDNNDIRSYLKELFEKDYNVITAEDGKAGLEITRKKLPDLVVSDVMMPEMDGLEFCQEVKSDMTTSHIPIILLTAKASTQHELEGLQTGADDYVRKPFDSRVIQSRVETLLNNRKNVQSYFANKIRFEPNIQPPEENKSLSLEEDFIEKAIKFIEENIDNDKLNVEFLSDEFCMSQSTLYRKIKSLTGLSSVSFIRSIRLKKAAELILNEDLKFSAVAYMVGFNDYKYFKRAFTKEYGMTPTEYKATKQKEQRE